MARFHVPRRQYSRAHIEVTTSIMSRTRSSAVSPGSATTIRRSWAASAASRCSNPKRASRYQRSTTITVADGSDRIRRGPAACCSARNRPYTPPRRPHRSPWPTRSASLPAGPSRRADHGWTPALTRPREHRLSPPRGHPRGSCPSVAAGTAQASDPHAPTCMRSTDAYHSPGPTPPASPTQCNTSSLAFTHATPNSSEPR